MSIDDYFPFSEDDDFIDGLYNLIIEEKNLNVTSIESYCENFEGYYNSDIENKFQSNLFHDDYLEYIDIEQFLEEIELANNKLRSTL